MKYGVNRHRMMSVVSRDIIVMFLPFKKCNIFDVDVNKVGQSILWEAVKKYEIEKCNDIQKK